ncbi:MAG: arginine decarboxylase [Verrucomicrobia bacterium 61-8]|nr:biosynthetic arginine decarboxylase [Verrucomicrobiota bacterium]OJV01582.1 MAG: arginine decarboxylase [Verrucomicrobia bacterium 61-8]
MSDFGREDAIALYNVDRWGGGYFTVNKRGNVTVMPNGSSDQKVDLTEIIREAKARNLSFPLTVRFHDLLRDRVETINRAFADAIAESGYQNVYRGVFPIKVNQLREVVEEILDAGKPWHFGIEAGSKPELIAAMALHSDPESLIICNGYKDTSFIRNALVARKLGKIVILVVEKLEELKHILKVAAEMNVEPMIGLRVRLLSKGAGKWATSGGENAKFGLSTADLVRASDMLAENGLSQALKLVHFHVGSQVPDIGTIKRAVKEASRFYAKLSKMGHQIEYLDVGGGLGVDYDGSRTTFDSSTNYSLNEYARDIVYSVMEVCNAEHVAHPTIVSESGRAIVAHHSVLIVETFGSIEKNSISTDTVTAEVGDPPLVQDIIELSENIGKKNRLESLHDAQEIRERAQSMFDLGMLDLRAKARIETVYWQIAEEVVAMFRGMRYIPEEVKEMEVALGDQFLCNFSVFQSLLDHWALGQLFPVMPISRLNELPDRNATMVDITCDSDGKVSKFVDLQDVKETLPVHRWVPGEPYYMGFFLVGAYQDIMGDMHNLFGRVNEMHIYLDEDEDAGYYVEEVLPGSTIGQVLTLTQWDTNELARRIKAQVDAAIKSDRLKPNEAMKLLDDYEKSLNTYTYLNFDDQNTK